MNKSLQLKKLFNILTIRIFTVLGARLSLFFFLQLMMNCRNILRDKTLSSVDGKMNVMQPTKFKFRDKTLFFDCAASDNLEDENSSSFGLIREILVADCYLKDMSDDQLNSLDCIIDIGANRGVFSSLMSKYAKRIICVEFQEKYLEVLKSNLKDNSFFNYEILKVYISGCNPINIQNSRDATTWNSSFLDMNQLFGLLNLEWVSLVKLDIEGEEFNVFNDSSWMAKCDFVTMEVHGDLGNVEELVKQIQEMNFWVRLRDSNLQKTSNYWEAKYIFGRNLNTT